MQGCCCCCCCSNDCDDDGIVLHELTKLFAGLCNILGIADMGVEPDGRTHGELAVF